MAQQGETGAVSAAAYAAPMRRLSEPEVLKGGLQSEAPAWHQCSGVRCPRAYRTRSEPALAGW